MCAQNYPRRGATQLFQRVNAFIEDQILCIVLTWLQVCVMALGPVDCAERGCRWFKKVRVPWYMFTSWYVHVRVPSFKGIKEINHIVQLEEQISLGNYENLGHLY